MKTAIRAGGLWCGMTAMLVAGSLLFAQDAKDKKSDTKPKAAAKKASNRVPDNFGKLNLSDEQKTKIYAIQDANAAKIDDLTKQLNAARKKMQDEIDAVLTADQLKQIGEIRAEAAKKKAADKAAKASAAKSTEAVKAEPEKKPAEKK